jgi:hypothetical protein
MSFIHEQRVGALRWFHDCGGPPIPSLIPTRGPGLSQRRGGDYSCEWVVGGEVETTHVDGVDGR